jgi:hypothetical protein
LRIICVLHVYYMCILCVPYVSYMCIVCVFSCITSHYDRCSIRSERRLRMCSTRLRIMAYASQKRNLRYDVSCFYFTPTHTHNHTHTQTYAEIHLHTHAYTHTYTHKHIRKHTQACLKDALMAKLEAVRTRTYTRAHTHPSCMRESNLIV